MFSSHLIYRGSIAINAHIRINLPSKADEGNAEIWFLLSRHVRDDGQPPLYISLHVFQEDGGSVSFVQPEYLTVRVIHSISHSWNYTDSCQQGVYQEGIHYLVCPTFYTLTGLGDPGM